MNQKTSKKTGGANFGKIGWQLIIFSGFCFMFTGSFWGSAAVNVVSVQVANLLGMETNAAVLALNTSIALSSIVVCLVMTILHGKFKARILIPIEFFILAISLFTMGRITGLAMYFLAFLGIYSMANTIAQTALGVVFGNYMPTKKGMALGWSTVGASLSSVVSLPLLNALCNGPGFKIAMTIFALILLILGCLYMLLWPDDPKARGYLPDNGDVTEEELKQMGFMQENRVKCWTIGEIVKNKNFWFIVLGYGLLFMCTSGIAQQLVVFEVLNGVPQSTAISIMSITAIVGMFGSIVSGYIDMKLGVKVMAMLMGLSYALSCFFAGFMPFNAVTNVLFIAFYCLVVGAMSNLPMSHGIGIYGADFKFAWRIIIPFVQIIPAFAGLLLGKARELTGGYVAAYRVLMVLAIIAIIIFAFSDSKVIKKPGEKPVAVKITNKKKAETTE